MSDANNAPQTQSTPAPQSPAQGQGDDGRVVDYGEILARQQHELARTGKTVESLREELGKSHGTIERVRQAFAPEQEKLSPYQQRIRDFDELAQHMEQEARDLPLTSKIGKQLAAYGKEAESRAEKLEQELAELKAAMKRQQNPAFQGLERAAFVMEGMVEEGLESLYGANSESKSIRAAQFNAVTARINEEIKDLMRNDPEALLKVQRNPKIMRKMVNHFMAEMLPPKVRQHLDDERIKNEPFDARQLYQAFAEAKEQWQQAQADGDERAEQHFSNLMTNIRHDILAEQQGARRASQDKPSLNQLFGGR